MHSPFWFTPIHHFWQLFVSFLPKNLEEWELRRIPWQLVPVLNYPFSNCLLPTAVTQVWLFNLFALQA